MISRLMVIGGWCHVLMQSTSWIGCVTATLRDNDSLSPSISRARRHQKPETGYKLSVPFATFHTEISTATKVGITCSLDGSTKLLQQASKSAASTVDSTCKASSTAISFTKKKKNKIEQRNFTRLDLDTRSPATISITRRISSCSYPYPAVIDLHKIKRTCQKKHHMEL